MGAALLAAPLSILWGLLFSLLSVFYVWIIRPVMRIVETLLAIFRRFWVVLLNYPRPGLRRCWWHLQVSTQARPVRLMNNFALFEKDFQRRSQFKTLRLIISVNVALLSMLTK